MLLGRCHNILDRDPASSRSLRMKNLGEFTEGVVFGQFGFHVFFNGPPGTKCLERTPIPAIFIRLIAREYRKDLRMANLRRPASAAAVNLAVEDQPAANAGADGDV